jgi:Flp pilus assembly protein TadG
MRPTKYGSRKHRRGTAAVEMAIILPLLMAILLGCVDFGRFAYTYIAVTNASRSGAAFASSHPFTATTRQTWEQRTRDAAVAEMGAAFDEANIDVPSPVVTTESDGLKRVRVKVTYPFETIVNWHMWDNQIPITRAVEMRFIR